MSKLKNACIVKPFVYRDSNGGDYPYFVRWPGEWWTETSHATLQEAYSYAIGMSKDSDDGSRVRTLRLFETLFDERDSH
jgi:hypothetical protein